MDDFFDNRWFYYTKRFACHVGQWPFQSRMRKNFIRIGGQLYVYSVLPALIREFCFLWSTEKVEAVVQILPLVFTLSGTVVKYNQYSFNENKVKQLFLQVKADFAIVMGMKGPAREVLEKYADISRMTVHFYARIFILMPNVTILLNVISPRNHSRQVRFLYPVNFGKYTEEYRHLISLYLTVGTVMFVFMLIACDCMYISLVCHGCGVFGVVRDRLNRIDDAAEIERIQETECLFEYHDVHMASLRKMSDRQVALIASCIKFHGRAIRFGGLLDSCYSGNFLVIICLSVIIISITGLQIIIKLGDWEQMIAGGIYFAAQLLHLFFLSLPGQLMMDVSNSVRESAYNAHWYKLPANTQKLLIPIILRSSKPCVISAGSFFVLSMETFMSIVHSAMSYLTVLYNFC